MWGPAASFYSPDDMTSSARAAFYAWYEKQQGKTFNFQKEFLSYCISDVDILQRCCAQFRQTIHALVKVEPFQEAITFASTANLAYRRGFMPQDSIAIIPNLGYHPARQFSLKASRWLSWLGRDLPIQHAWNGEFVKNLINHPHWISPPEMIVWCYREWRPAYEFLKERVRFIQDIPEDDEKIVRNTGVCHLLIFDDMMGGGELFNLL